MTASAGAGRAGLGMYPFAPIRPEFDTYWASVHDRARWLPARLDWTLDPPVSSVAADVVVAQTCGWPLVEHLGDLVRVVGAFEPMVPGAVGHRYRSVLVARASASALDDLGGARAAVNSFDSLSGWVSLVSAVPQPAARWSGPITLTGSHLESVRALHEDRADVASIDSVSWVHIQRFAPELVAGVVEVGSGPLVPAPPVVASATTTDDELTAIRLAMAEAFHDDAARTAMAGALMGGFVPLELADYISLRALRPGPAAG